MAKRGPESRPWYRKGTRSWYVTLDGKQVPLGKDRTRAMDEYHKLMVARRGRSASPSAITVGELARLWIEECRAEKKPRTVENYELYIDSFTAVCGSLRVKDLRVHHVKAWIKEQVGRGGGPWSPSTRHLAISIVKAMVSWGEKDQYIDFDPIRKLERPPMSRRPPITMADAQAIMEAVRPEIREALRVLLTTGVRPGEACSMVAEKTDLDGRKAIVTGKTGTRTVYLSPASAAVLGPLKERHPTGHLLIDSKGAPMTVNALMRCVVRARRSLSRARFGPEKSRELEHIKPHCFRGLFSTEALRSGAGMLEVSKLLGHKDVTMLARHYASPDDEMLLRAADQATRMYGTASDNPPDPRG